MKAYVQRTDSNIFRIKVSNGVIHVLANKKLTYDKIVKEIMDNKQWILDRCKTNYSEINKDCNTISDMYAGRKCLICGKIYSVGCTVEKKSYAEKDTLYIPKNKYESKTERVKAIKQYIKKISSVYFANEVSTFGSKISLCPKSIELKQLNGVWMRCTSPDVKVITIDYRAVQLPKELQQYLIVHSFCHIYRSGHDDKFWNIVSNFCPHYQEMRNKLAEYEFIKDI